MSQDKVYHEFYHLKIQTLVRVRVVATVPHHIPIPLLKIQTLVRVGATVPHQISIPLQIVAIFSNSTTNCDGTYGIALHKYGFNVDQYQKIIESK